MSSTGNDRNGSYYSSDLTHSFICDDNSFLENEHEFSTRNIKKTKPSSSTQRQFIRPIGKSIICLKKKFFY